MKKDNSLCTRAFYHSYLESLNVALCNTVVTDRDGQEMDQEAALMLWCRMVRDIKKADNTLYFVGNGASATMASHMAADFSKNCGCKGMAFNDIALMTAVSNDIHYDDCFSVPLQRFANPEDLLITVSSSGNSPNVVKALETARTMGIPVVTLSGMNADNKTRRMGDLNFWVPADTYGLVEASHQALLHCWLDTFLDMYGS